jgi:hypothetical protein
VIEEHEVLAQIEAEAAQAPRERLAVLVGALERIRAIAWARLTSSAAEPSDTDRPRWISPGEAATIAGVTTRVIYEWSRGKKWASRPSRRCLRLDESGFRSWLAARNSY